MSWVLTLLEERYIYNYSTIAIVETSDLRHALRNLFNIVIAINKIGDVSCPLPDRFIYYSADKLYEIHLREDKNTIELRPLKKGNGRSLFESITTVESVSIVDALDIYYNMAIRDGRILMIFNMFGIPREAIYTIYPKISDILSDPTHRFYHSGSLLIFVTDDRDKFRPFLSNVIFVRDEPSEEEIRGLISLFKAKLESKNIKVSVEDDKILELVRGLEYKDVENILYKLRRKLETGRKIDIIRELISERNRIILQSLPCLEPIESKYGLEAVGGYSEIKEIVRRSFINVWKHRELARSLGAELPKGMLLFGIRGTGKTWFVKCMAKELDLPMYRFNIELVKSHLYGETEKTLRYVFKMLRKIQPVILFIDEVDKLMTQRGGLQEHEVTRAIKNIMLEELSERDEIILICTTNFPEQLDEAFLRAGRIDIKLPFLLPDYEARKQILEIHTKIVRKVPLGEDVDLDKLARKTSGWTGAEIEQLVKEAIIYALDEAVRKRVKKMKVHMEHFETAYENIIVDRDVRARELERYMNASRMLTSHREVMKYLEKQYNMVMDEVRGVVGSKLSCL